MNHPSRWPSLLQPGWLRPYRAVTGLLTPEELGQVRDGILDSPYLAETDLNARFRGTRGFRVLFRREGLPQVLRDFPRFAPYLERVLHPRCNGFHLNPLVIERGVRVEPHRDLSLGSWLHPLTPDFPVKVSVLYVDRPEGLAGGQLVLHGRRPLATFDPRPNLLVEFLGSLRHEVTEVQSQGPSPPPRISLVCEQYRLTPAQLDRLPTYAVRTRRPFGDFLRAVLGEAPPEPAGPASPPAVGTREGTS